MKALPVFAGLIYVLIASNSPGGAGARLGTPSKCFLAHGLLQASDRRCHSLSRVMICAESGPRCPGLEEGNGWGPGGDLGCSSQAPSTGSLDRSDIEEPGVWASPGLNSGLQSQVGQIPLNP